MKPKGLGKGLSAIFETEQHNVAGVEIATGSLEIDIKLIDPNPDQPRTTFDAEALGELAESISRLGVIQPITVRRVDDRYQIISGERRYRASQMAGLISIPSYVRMVGDAELLEMALVENVQREELGAMEIALTLKRLTDELGLTQQALSKSVGQRRSTVANYLRLLTLSPSVQKALYEDIITMGHAKALAAVEDEARQQMLLEKIVKSALSVRATEELIAQDKLPRMTRKVEKRDFSQFADRLGNIFGAKCVKIDASAKGSGSVTLKFKNEAELRSIIEKIDK